MQPNPLKVKREMEIRILYVSFLYSISRIFGGDFTQQFKYAND